MHHPNASTPSLDENLYDISISKNGSSNNLQKKRFAPRRVGSLSCLNSLPDQKRPSEYYLQKLSQTSTPTLKSLAAKHVNSSTHTLSSLASQENSAPTATSSHKRPTSDSSEASSDNGKDSDDAVSVISTPFDVPDSRLSSMTNYSTYSTSKLSDSAGSTKSPVLPSSFDSHTSASMASPRPHITPIVEKHATEFHDTDATPDQLSRSLSSVTLKGTPAFNSALGSTSELSGPSPQKELPPTPLKQRAASSSVLELQRQPTYQSQLPKLARQASASSSFGLTRTKTRYYSSKETKERKQQRKKLYEENDDDELLVNDIDLVFNVPVMKNHGEIYRTRRSESVPNVLLTRNDIVTGGDNKYPSSATETMRPCPLPGKLYRSNVSVDRIPTVIPESRALSEEDIVEDNEMYHTSFASSENDTQISNNISDFYQQRSLSYSTLAKASRDHELADRMPNYVRAQCSVEDLSFVSSEKLDVLDQSRPINLPPKNFSDKTKHHRELHKLITEYETMTKHVSSARMNLGLSTAANQQEWLKLMMTGEEKAFERRLNGDREKWRKLSWESLVSTRFRFKYFMKALLAGTEKDFIDTTKQNHSLLESKIEGLPRQMKSTKDAEFNSMIDHVLQRPLYRNFVIQAQETGGANFDFHEFRQNFRHLLYIKSFSEGGLQKHHQIFVIPTFLILFQSTESFEGICLLIELFDDRVFNTNTLSLLNSKLSSWSDVSKLSQSNPIHRALKRFSSLQEFENLSSTSLFELIIQLNDRLPLSLSAPSTPIVAQGSFRALSRPSAEMDGSGSNASPATTSEGDVSGESEQIYSASSSLSLVGTFLQLLVIYSRSKKQSQRVVNLLQSFLLTVFQYYHINWNSCGELVKANKSIKLNNSSDQMTNLESFVDKWRDIYKKL